MKFYRRFFFIGFCMVAAGCASVCSLNHQSAQSPANAHAPNAPAFAPVAEGRLTNAHIVTPRVIAGAQPEGDEGFAALRDLGIKTIISVDGTAPDVATAKKFGLRYVHLPITYATVTPEQGKAIAKAIDELPGPIYLHCHHGQHRSAAAVAVACIYDGSLEPNRAESLLKTFGTGENYKGLWKAALNAKPVDPREIRDLNIQFVETAKIPALAEAMVLVDGQLDHLKAIQQAGWQTPRDHPDLDPPHEALQLQEHLREIGRRKTVQEKPADFKQKLVAAEEQTSVLRQALLAKPINPQIADGMLKQLSASCLNCHKTYRN